MKSFRSPSTAKFPNGAAVGEGEEVAAGAAVGEGEELAVDPSGVEFVG